MFHPDVPPTVTTMSALMPASASAITAFQSTAFRSCGVRALPARKRDLYDRTGWMNWSRESDTPLIHAAGVGKPPPAPDAVLFASARALSNIASVAAMTSLYPLSGGIESLPILCDTIPAESYETAR